MLLLYENTIFDVSNSLKPSLSQVFVKLISVKQKHGKFSKFIKRDGG